MEIRFVTPRASTAAASTRSPPEALALSRHAAADSSIEPKLTFA